MAATMLTGPGLADVAKAKPAIASKVLPKPVAIA
jgi:hypothetical protein